MKGVYKISNVLDNRVYIGSSINVIGRLAEHKRDLKNNCHHNIHLQRFVNKYGLDKLNFNLFEECDNYLEREQYYLDTLDNLFNTSISATAPMLGKKHTKESLKKISEASKGKNNAMYGRKRKQSVIDKMQEARWKNGASKYERLKRLANLPNRKELIIKNGGGVTMRCFSLSHASSIIGVTQQSVSGAINRKAKCKGWVIEVVDNKLYDEVVCLKNINLFNDDCHPQPELIEMLKSL